MVRSWSSSSVDVRRYILEKKCLPQTMDEIEKKK